MYGYNTPRDKQDAPRNEGRVRLAVQMGTRYAVICGQLLDRSKADKDGWIELTCYKSDLKEVDDSIHTDLPGLEMAQQAYESDARSFVLDALKINDSELPLDVSQWPEETKAILDQYTGSVEGAYQRIRPRSSGIKPLKAKKVLEDNLPPPKSVEADLVSRVVSDMKINNTQINQSELAAVVAQAVAQTISQLNAKASK